MNYKYTLVPLRIPMGWAVLYNNGFFEEDMIVENGTIKNNLSYKEDILHLSTIEYKESIGYVISSEQDENSYSIDLGWTPDSDPDGEYILSFMHKNWNNVILSYSSKDKNKIREVIEILLDWHSKKRGDDLVVSIKTDQRLI